MKIAILGTRGFPKVQGGVEAHCEGLSVHLVKLGCEVVVFTRKPYVDPNLREYQGVRLWALPAWKNKSLEAFLHTFIGVFVALRTRPDILHIQAIGPALFVPMARLLGFKVVLTTHGSNYRHLKWGLFAKMVLRLGEFLGVRFSNQVIAISPMIAEEIQEKYQRQVVVIPNGVTTLGITQSRQALQDYHLTDQKYILNVGCFVPEKGVHVLIEAFNKAADSKRSRLNEERWKLVIVGKADHEDSYSLGLKEKAKINDRIVFAGFLSGKPLQELYSHAGLFVLPSFYEGLPIALLEAMSYGVFCIASDIPANRGVALPADRYFKVGDSEALKLQLEQSIGTSWGPDEKRSQIERVSTDYDWKTVVQQTMGVYEKVLGVS